MKCQSCGAVADEYIECEIMILLIDLILHKAKAYRHLFYNMFDRQAINFEGLMWKLTFGFLLLDAFTSEGGWDLDPSLTSLIWGCGKILLDTLVGNLLFISILLLGTRSLLSMSSEVSGFKNVWLAILASSYLKLFLVTMMVWEFPSSVIFILDIFVLSSNTLALHVILPLHLQTMFAEEELHLKSSASFVFSEVLPLHLQTMSAEEELHLKSSSA
ncbi:protein arv1 homolog isoform X1 [Tanacetum coccineum]